MGGYLKKVEKIKTFFEKPADLSSKWRYSFNHKASTKALNTLLSRDLKSGTPQGKQNDIT